MASKQQPNRQTQNASSSSSQSTPQSLIFCDFDFQGEQKELLIDLKKNYRGIQDAVPIYHEGSNGEPIHAIRIDVKSDDFANQFLEKKQIRIDDIEYLIKSSSTKSIIVRKVPSGEKLGKILQDLSHNYLGIVKISRFYESNGTETDSIRIDFKSNTSLTKIFKDNYILIDGKRRSIQPYLSLVYAPRENENEIVNTSEQTQNSVSEQVQNTTPKQTEKFVSEQRQKPSPRQSQMYLTERRVKELFREQQTQLEAMINEFENKWNARLSSLLPTASANTNADQLLPIVKDLTMVTQQFNQQNAQLQRQLGSIVHQIQDSRFKLTNEQVQQAWPQLPTQNGH